MGLRCGQKIRGAAEVRVPYLAVAKMKPEHRGSSGRRGEERLAPAGLRFFYENILLVTLLAVDTVLTDTFIVSREVRIAV